MQETIYLNDVLEEMRTPNKEGRAILFNISVRSLNKNSKTGGKMYHYENAKLVMEETSLDPLGIKALQMLPSEKRVIFKKSPNHFKNKTRNLRLENGDVKKIHIKHIINFNGKKVIY